MKFLELHPDYQNYTHNTYIYEYLPDAFYNAFHGLVIGAVNNTDYPQATLRRSCDIIATKLPDKTTSNTGYSWLVHDLDNYLRKLKTKRLNKILDIIAEVAGETEMELDDLNESFEENHFGFYLTWQRYEGYMWNMVDDTESYVETIEEALDEVSTNYINVLEHLQQAKKQLTELSSARPRKDALRDCLSALEAHLKYYAPGTRKIEQSINFIMTNHSIPRLIIMEAKTIWDRIHDQTPDVRHGTNTNSNLSEAEALYWIDRIMALIKYLSREIDM